MISFLKGLKKSCFKKIYKAKKIITGVRLGTLERLKTPKISLPLIVVLCAIFLVIGALAQLTIRTSIGSTGTIKTMGLGVYWDGNCSTTVSSIAWGMIEPGSAKNVAVYLKNEGNIVVALSLDATNWSPENAKDYLTLSWNHGGQSISPDEVIQVTFTLTVSSDAQGITGFSFDIIITGTG